MAQQSRDIVTASICSLSWIDQRTGLPEHDGAGPPRSLPGYKVGLENDALPFRFMNLLEGTVGVVKGRIVSNFFTVASRIYQNPSFGQIKSEAFAPKQAFTPYGDRTVFEQTVGARTVSPEVIAQGVGGVGGSITNIPFADRIGRAVAHEFFGFPPIWTTLRLTIYADGRAEGTILCHSLFPSMSFYTLQGGVQRGARASSVYNQVGDSYDARPNLEKWKTDGWGSQSGGSGPCSGNPWGYSKNDLSARPAAAGNRLA